MLKVNSRTSTIALLAAFAIVTAPVLIAQATPVATADTYVPTLTFDVATIRESPREGGGIQVKVNNPPHASKLELTNFTGKALLQLAYGFGTPVVGGPDWLSDTYFTVEAKSDHTVDEQLAKLSDDNARLEKQHMLQVLLADRLQLKSHFETKETSVYALGLAKGGSKLKETKVDPADPDPSKPAGALGPDVKAHGGAQGLQFDVQRMTTKAVAAMLTSQLTSPIIDQTGLTGTYDFTLQIGRDWSSTNPESWPDIFTAIQEQLGLKLDSTKASIPNLIIDHIEKPSAN